MLRYACVDNNKEVILVQKGADGVLYTSGPQKSTSPANLTQNNSTDEQSLAHMKNSKEKVSFVKQVSPDGQEGLTMLIEDMVTQRQRTIVFKLDEVVDEQSSNP